MANPRTTGLFTLNTLGYLGLLAPLYLPVPQMRGRRRLVRRVLMGYAALTFMLFFVWGVMKAEWPVIGFVDKMEEVLLIALLWREDRAASSVGWDG